jgi:hypothetical protein
MQKKKEKRNRKQVVGPAQTPRLGVRHLVGAERKLLGSALPSIVSLKDYVGGLGLFALRLIPRSFL